MNWLLLRNSFAVSGAATLLAAGLGLAGALWLGGLPARWRKVMLAMAVMALALPPFLVTNCWLHYLGHAGVWRHWLPLSIISPGGVVWLLGLLLWPITLLALWGAWQRLDPSQLESDPALAGWPLVRGLLLPLARNALAQAALLTFVLALNHFAVPAILQVKVFPAEIWVRFNTNFDTAGAVCLCWPLVLGPLLLLLWLARGEIPWPRLSGPLPPALFRRQLGRSWWCACGAVSLLLAFLALGLPLLQLVSARRTWSELPGALAAGQSAVWNSAWFAAASATLIVALGLVAAECAASSSRRPTRRWAPAPAGTHGTASLRARLENRPERGWRARRAEWRGASREHMRQKSVTETQRSQTARPAARHPGVFSKHALKPLAARLPAAARLRWADLVGWLLWLPLLVPGVLLGIGCILLFNRPWSALFYQSAGIVILAFTLRYLALGWNLTLRARRGVDPDLTDAARLEGASRWQLLRRVHWPQIAPQAAAAWYIVFLLCLWDIESVILIVPPGGETLALRVFNLLHYGHNAQVNALCLTLLALAVAPLLLWGAWTAARRTLVWNLLRNSNLGARFGGLRISGLAVFCLPALLLPVGCSPPLASTEAALESQLFSRVQVIGSRGVGIGQLNKPRSVAVDAADNLYVVDMTGRVQKFDSNGVFQLLWQMPQTDRGKPKGMCRGRTGDIVVVEPHYQRINHFSTTGRLRAQWGQTGTNAGQFTLPRAVAVNSQNEIYVSEYGTVERIQRFSLSSTGAPPRLLGSFGQPGNAPGELNRPEGLCVDAQDRVYVADSCNHRIQVFSRDGHFLRAYGRPGRGRGELSYPYDICLDAAGRQYVCEFGNSRIQVFDARDQPLEIIGGPGAAPGQFSNPWGVALDSAGNLYVADSQNHRVQKLIRRPHAAARGPLAAIVREPDSRLSITAPLTRNRWRPRPATP